MIRMLIKHCVLNYSSSSICNRLSLDQLAQPLGWIPLRARSRRFMCCARTDNHLSSYASPPNPNTSSLITSRPYHLRTPLMGEFAAELEGLSASARHEDAVWSVEWTNSDRILSGSVDETARVWTPDLQLQKIFAGHRLGVTSVAASSTEPCFVTSSIDSILRLWNLETGSLQHEVHTDPGETWTVDWAQTGPLIASGSQHGTVNVWNVQDSAKPSLSKLDTKGETRFIFSVAFSPDGKLLACGGSDGEVHLFDLSTGQHLAAMQGHTKAVRSLAFLPTGYALMTASDDLRINVYEVSQHALVSTYTGHASWVLSVAASPDGRHFASGGADRRIKLWDLAMKECLHTVERHQDAVWSLAFSPNDANLLVSGAEDGGLMVSNISQHIS